MSSWALPELSISWDKMVDVRQALVLGGRSPDPDWMGEALKGLEVWAVDSGVDACMDAGIRPDHVLGDFDSIGERAREWAAGLGLNVLRYPADKDYTDFQLCLERTRGDLLVTGCWGGRFDHAYSNFFSFFWGRERESLIAVFADESEVLFPLEGEGSAEIYFSSRPAAVSLLPMSELCAGVSIVGVKWELHDVALSQSCPYAISNVPVEDKISVRVETGVLGVYCFNGFSAPF